MNILDWNESNITSIAHTLSSGSVIVLPTDTIYGLVGVAYIKDAFERIYGLKKRNHAKKLIVLIGSPADLNIFGIKPTSKQQSVINKLWPGPYSLELPCNTEKYSYLLCGTNSLSFRCPDDKLLQKLLNVTGPLVAPSANPEGMEPAANIQEAQNYFGDRVPLYVDGGKKESQASSLISLLGEKVQLIRGELPGGLDF